MAEYIRKPTETPVVKKEFPTSFVMVKNVRGSFALDIEPYDFSSPAREIYFTADLENQRLPAKLAVGVFVTPQASKLMDRGYFTFENLQGLVALAESLGIYVPDSIKEPKVELKDMRIVLFKNDLAGIKTVMMNASKKTVGDFISEARRLLGKLNMETVGYIEKTYGVRLAPVDLNE